MDKEERGSESHHAGGFVMLAAAVAAVVLLRPLLPWESARPLEGDSRAHVATRQVDARLWQDPLGAVRRAGLGPGIESVSSPDFWKFACKASGSVGPAAGRPEILLLGVMVAGGPYPVDTEARRRARYAVLSALNTAGFVPEDSEHLQVLAYDLGGSSRPGADGSSDQGSEGSGSRKAVRGPSYVPYERFRLARPGVVDENAAERKVVVLWLGEQFRARPIEQLDRLFGPLKARCGSAPVRPELVMLGPLFSADLHGMLEPGDAAARVATRAGSGVEAAGSARRREPADAGPDVTFYAYGVTAESRLLGLPDRRGDVRSDWPIDVTIDGVRIRVLRSIADDARVAQALARELQARGVDPAAGYGQPGDGPRLSAEMPRPRGRDDVILVTEWDTLDIRALTQTVTQVLDGTRAGARAGPSKVHAFTYLRGLDGLLPKPDKKDDDKDASDNNETGKPAHRGRRASDRDIERPDGQSQYDYLRRLSTRLQALQRSLRDQGRGIGAIGVLGSDAFDKLLILQALRSQFPGVVFFTTDMDARLLHPGERDWTRNLVVASSFGLELHPSLQQGIAPFRDSYQTSLYLSALSALSGLHRVDASTCTLPAGSLSGRAIGCPLAQALFGQAPHPARLYEIGRTRAFDLSDNPPGMAASPAGHDASAGCDPARGLDRCSLIHPLRPDLFARPSAGALAWGVGLGLAALLGWSLANGWLHRLLSELTRARAEPADRRPQAVERRAQAALSRRRSTDHRSHAVLVAFVRLALAALVVLAILLLATVDRLWIWLAEYLTQQGRGEPIALFEGVSVWPTTLLRLFSAALALGLLVRGWVRLERNLEKISRRLGLQQARTVIAARQRQAAGSRLGDFLRIFSFRLSEVHARTVDPESGLTPDAEAFWAKYILQNRPVARFLRVVSLTALYWMAAHVLIGMVAGRPAAPLRGAVSQFWQYPVTLVSVLSMLLLIFFVVDATVFCYQFVRELHERYPGPQAELGARIESPIGVPPESRWPSAALQYHTQKLKLDARHVEHLLNMRFVAMRTQAVGSLIYYPYIVISLMFVSRSTIFDRWGTPFVIDLLNGVSVLIVTVCAILLRRGAEQLRRKSIGRLGEDMIALRGGDEAQRQRADQVGLLIEQIRAFREGAFAPYSQQPLVRALLLPLSGLGGTALLELMSAADL